MRAAVSVPTARNVDLYLQKSALAGTDTVVPGGEIVYTLVYGNNGADPATGVQITDILPAHTTLVAGSITGEGVFVTASNTISWALAGVASQASGTVSFTVQIADPLPAGVDAIANSAAITPATAITDAVPANNTSGVSTPVSAAPDLTITKSDGRTQVLAGDLLTWKCRTPVAGGRRRGRALRFLYGCRPAQRGKQYGDSRSV